MLGCGVAAQGQSASVPVLETTPSPRAAAMGGIPMQRTDAYHIYNNPAGLFSTDEKLHISAADEWTATTIDNGDGREHAVSVGAAYRLHPKHALMVGFRYLGGFKLYMLDSDETLKPNDWTIDVGYAYNVAKDLSLFATAGVVQSDQGNKATAFTASVGAAYTASFSPSTFMPNDLYLSFRVADFGSKLKYGNQTTSYALPTSLQLGAEWHLAISDKVDAALSSGARYYCFTSDRQDFNYGVGAECGLFRTVYLRGGFQHTYQAEHVTMGVGVKWKMIGLDFTYRQKLNTDYGVNTLQCGVSVHL